MMLHMLITALTGKADDNITYVNKPDQFQSLE